MTSGKILAGGLAALTLLVVPPMARAADHIKIGTLKATNVGPVYIAIDKGYFAEEGLEPELVSFESAQPIAVANAAGSIDFGATSTSAGLYSLAAQGTIKIIGGMYSEAPGFHNFALAASGKAYEGGLKSYKDLPSHSVAVTQVGSPVQYSLALIVEKYKLDLASIKVLPLQSIPNMASALIGVLLYGGGALASALMGAFVTPATPVPLTSLMALFGASGVATYLLFRPRQPR